MPEGSGIWLGRGVGGGLSRERKLLAERPRVSHDGPRSRVLVHLLSDCFASPSPASAT